MRAFDNLTPLHAAATKNEASIAKLLIKAGADLEAKHQSHVTALFIACQDGCFKTAKTLIKKGANVHTTRDQGISALFIASQEGHVKIVQLLLDAGADVNLKNELGSFPLFAATRRGHTAVVEVLLRAKNVDVNTQSQKWTALDLAIAREQMDIVRLLLRAGATARPVFFVEQKERMAAAAVKGDKELPWGVASTKAKGGKKGNAAEREMLLKKEKGPKEKSKKDPDDLERMRQEKEMWRKTALAWQQTCIMLQEVRNEPAQS